MASPNRTAILNKLYKTLKKLYTPTPPNLKMPLLEQVLYACCLEDATPAAAAKAFTALDEQYFDWNEVRVSTVTELGETISMLPEPVAAASRVKRVLQSVFESAYAFDLETLKKQNIGAAQKRLAKYDGITAFSVAYATQTGLGGHMVPLGRGALDVLYVIGAINEKERAAGEVPGMERAIPKNKGIEFGSLVNQLGVEYARNPMSPNIRKLLLSIAPDAKDRFAKRITKPEAVPAAPPAVQPPADGQAKAAGKGAAAVAPPKGKGGKPEPAPAPKKGTPPAKPAASTKPAPAAKPSAASGKATPAAKAKPTPPAAKKLPAKSVKSPPSRSKATSTRGAPRKPR